MEVRFLSLFSACYKRTSCPGSHVHLPTSPTQAESSDVTRSWRCSDSFVTLEVTETSLPDHRGFLLKTRSPDSIPKQGWLKGVKVVMTNITFKSEVLEVCRILLPVLHNQIKTNQKASCEPEARAQSIASAILAIIESSRADVTSCQQNTNGVSAFHPCSMTTPLRRWDLNVRQQTYFVHTRTCIVFVIEYTSPIHVEPKS